MTEVWWIPSPGSTPQFVIHFTDGTGMWGQYGFVNHGRTQVPGSKPMDDGTWYYEFPENRLRDVSRPPTPWQVSLCIAACANPPAARASSAASRSAEAVAVGDQTPMDTITREVFLNALPHGGGAQWARPGPGAGACGRYGRRSVMNEERLVFKEYAKQENRANPYPLYAQARQVGICRQHDGAYVVSRYARSRRCSTTLAFSSDPRNLADPQPPPPPAFPFIMQGARRTTIGCGGSP